MAATEMAKVMVTEMARKTQLAKDQAPTLLVWGFKDHGKSSFIDSVMRFMYEEKKNFVRRRAGSRAPDMYSVLHVFDDLSENVLFRLVDSPAEDEIDKSKSELSRVLKQGVWHKMRMGEQETAHAKHRLHPECVILVVSSRGCNMSELRALADTIHGTGTPFVVAVTNRRYLSSDYLRKYLKQVADACRNKSVFCFDNYVQSELGDVEQNEDSDSTCEMSKLLIQAMEYIWEDRINDKLYNKLVTLNEEDATIIRRQGPCCSEASVGSSDESFEVL